MLALQGAIAAISADADLPRARDGVVAAIEVELSPRGLAVFAAPFDGERASLAAMRGADEPAFVFARRLALEKLGAAAHREPALLGTDELPAGRARRVLELNGISELATFPLFSGERCTGELIALEPGRLGQHDAATLDALIAALGALLGKAASQAAPAPAKLPEPGSALALGPEWLETAGMDVQRLILLGSLVRGTAHLFNNVLATVEGYLSLTLQRPNLDERLRTRFERMATAADRGSTYTRRLRAFARAATSADDDEAYTVAELLDGVEALVEPHFGGQDRFVVAERPHVTLRGGRARLEQVIVTLALNGRDAMPDGGELTVTAREHDGEITIEIRDQGRGMDAAAVERAFEPFSGASSRGANLGLAVAALVARSRGGHLTLDSEPGEGTVVALHLPLASASVTTGANVTAAASSEGEESASPATDRALVLAVDDEEPIRLLLHDAFDHLGVEALVVSSCAEALELIEQLGARVPRMVMLDLTIPGESGMQNLRALRQRLPDAPIVISSGHSNAEMAASLLAQGATDFFPKPYRIDGLRAMVQRHVAGWT